MNFSLLAQDSVLAVLVMVGFGLAFGFAVRLTR